MTIEQLRTRIAGRVIEIDNLIAAEVVTADGQIVLCVAESAMARRFGNLRRRSVQVRDQTVPVRGRLPAQN